MNIKILTKDSLYVTINDTIYYIDDSTGEQIIEKWDATECYIPLKSVGCILNANTGDVAPLLNNGLGDWQNSTPLHEISSEEWFNTLSSHDINALNNIKS